MNFEKEFKALVNKLDEAIKENLRDIEESHQELIIISEVIDKYPDKFAEKGGMSLIVQDALDDARALIADGERLIKASVIIKRIK